MAQEAAKHELKYLQTQGVRARMQRGDGVTLNERGSVIPANEPQWAWPISVHQEPQGEGGCTQEE